MGNVSQIKLEKIQLERTKIEVELEKAKSEKRGKTIKLLYASGALLFILLLIAYFIHSVITTGKAPIITKFGVTIQEPEAVKKNYTELVVGLEVLKSARENLPSNQRELKDSLDMLIQKLSYQKDKARELLDKYKGFSSSSDYAQQKLLDEMKEFTKSIGESTSDIIIDWGIVKSSKNYNRIIDSLGKSSDNYLTQLKELKNRMDAISQTLTAKDSRIAQLEENNTQLRDSINMLQNNQSTAINDMLTENSKLKHIQDSLISITNNTEDIRTSKFLFAPISAKKRKDNTYKLSDIKSGLALNYCITANHPTAVLKEPIEIVFDFPSKNSLQAHREILKISPDMDKDYRQPFPNKDFSKGVYICQIVYKGVMIQSAIFEVK